jgi:secondary thiamine-phosphate synthase enzyme
MLQSNVMVTIPVRSTRREELIDVTDEVARLAREVQSGVVWLHCPHTTAALTIQENSDPELRDDYLAHLARLVPQPGFKHAEGNADAHIKASLIGSTQPVLVEDGALVLGTWQAIYFVELDGPRSRRLLARVSAS